MKEYYEVLPDAVYEKLKYVLKEINKSKKVYLQLQGPDEFDDYCKSVERFNPLTNNFQDFMSRLKDFEVFFPYDDNNVHSFFKGRGITESQYAAAVQLLTVDEVLNK